MAVTSLEPVSVGPGVTFPPVGAHVVSDGVSFRVWAPDHAKMRVVIGADGFETRYVELEPEADGFFAGRDEAGRAGDLYWFQADGRLLPDPASRFQPSGVEGPSQVIDPRAYRWQTPDWRRPPLRGRVIYELHVGTFTTEGTFLGAMGKLETLADLGVNTIELMPLNDFPGRWNWGYDGVMIFAPARCYGTPDELRQLIDAAHARGIAVIVDVVYNHLGPSGNVLPSLSSKYFHRERESLWGQGLNFDGDGSAAVRQFFLQNACMWFDEYRVDGLRLDAVHAIHDSSQPHIVTEIVAAAHARGGLVVVEDERNDARIVTPAAAGGWGADGMWADDFHHTARVALTGQQEAHFGGYRGAVAEWADTLRHGWHYRGQVFPVTNRPRGTACEHLSFEQFVLCISNHDQVGNRPLGDRLHAVVSLERYRALSMLFLLLPHTPLLFMGQEWAATTPFPFFTDFEGEIGERMADNRVNEFRHQKAHYDAATLARMPDPQKEGTFRAAKLSWSERLRPPHAQVWALYRECLQLRARERAFHRGTRQQWTIEAINEAVIALRARDPNGDWLLLGSVAEEGRVGIGDHAIVQPATGRSWVPVLGSNEVRFGGAGVENAWRGERGAAALTTPGTLVLRETV